MQWKATMKKGATSLHQLMSLKKGSQHQASPHPPST